MAKVVQILLQDREWVYRVVGPPPCQPSEPEADTVAVPRDLLERLLVYSRVASLTRGGGEYPGIAKAADGDLKNVTALLEA